MRRTKLRAIATAAAPAARDSAVELSPYETLRWSGPPDTYVRRAIVHAVFDVRPIEAAIGGDVPTLEIVIVAFEELRVGAKRSGRIELRYLVRDERGVIARGTVSVERPAAGPGIEQIVAAIGSALDAASGDLDDR